MGHGGRGRSDYPNDPSKYSEEATVEDIAALLDAVGTKKAIVGGLSPGGYMSQAFYSAYPDRVTALLIIDTGPGFSSDEAREAWNKNARDSIRVGNRGPFAFEIELSQRNANVTNSLPGIAVPSLVIVDANDAPFLNAADYMAKRIPGAQKMVITGAGHASNIDQPGIFNEAVLDFLSGAHA